VPSRRPIPLCGERGEGLAVKAGPDILLGGVHARWCPGVSGVAAAEKGELATRDGSVPLSLELPPELVFRLTPKEIRAAIRFALDEAERCRRPACPVEIDPKDAETPYKIVEETE
jgi:hypothetical protein